MADELKIVVAAHKPYWIPDDPCYLPVWVGAALRDQQEPEGWARDDAGDNISAKNGSYCELTALYWAWKNLDADYIGLAHYRRHFSRGPFGAKEHRVARAEDVLAKLMKAPVVLPTPRNYFIETNYSQYAHAHHAEDLDLTRDVLAELHPEVVAAWDASMQRTVGHRFNMAVMRSDLFGQWCDFLFSTLRLVEERSDLSNYSDYDRRLFGFLSERLLDPWIEANGIPYAEMPVVHMESQNWPRKASSFLKRKFSSSA